MVKVKKFRKRLGKRRIVRRMKRTMKRYTKKRPMYKKRISRKYGSNLRKKIYKRKSRKANRSGVKQFKKYKYGVIGNMKKRLSYKNLSVTGSSVLDIVSPSFTYFLNCKKLAVATMEGLRSERTHSHQIGVYSDNRAKLFRDNLLGNGYEGLMENPILNMVKVTVSPHMTFQDKIVQFSMYDKFNNNPESTGAIASLLSMNYANYLTIIDEIMRSICVLVSYPSPNVGASRNYYCSMAEFVNDSPWFQALLQAERDLLAGLNRAQLYETYATELIGHYFASVYHRAPSSIGQMGLHILVYAQDVNGVVVPVYKHRAVMLGQVNMVDQPVLSRAGSVAMEVLYREALLDVVKRTENVSISNGFVRINNIAQDRLRILYSLNEGERLKFCLFLGQAMRTMGVKADSYNNLAAGAEKNARLAELPFLDYLNELSENREAAVVDYNYLHQLIKDGYVRVKFLSKKKLTFKPKGGSNSHFYFVSRGNGLKLKSYYRRDLSTLAEVFAKINRNENLRQGLTEEGRKLLRKINPAFNFNLLGARID